GLRSGLDIAKALSLGATLGGMALPLLKPAMVSYDSLLAEIEKVQTELKVAMYLTGATDCRRLQMTRKYVTGLTREMTSNTP
ncbi:MAG: alpha-hydroxy-acid oxidizing protein, partial [Methanomicrobium sp.]|nr:alpha-hydroxy-acid oxidizing protein [Methanomicrobium sp.]